MLTIHHQRLLICLCLMFCFTVQAQESQERLDQFSGKLISAITNQGTAKAYLVTDKSIFKPGENIWFRAFLINSVSQKVITRNKYLFVDLVNEKDSVISIVLLDAANQQLNGQIALPPDILPGYYWLRTYTKQMAEEDTGNCFVKPLYVIGKSGKPLLSRTNIKTVGANNIPEIKFYPEGGAIITGTNSTVAFDIRDAQQKPISLLQGYIKDNRDSIVSRFTSNKFGLGNFVFFPSSYRKYKAYLNRNGKEVSYDLPPFNFRAGQLSVVKRKEGNLTLRVLLEDSIYKKDLETYVIGVSKDILCFAAIGHGQYELGVPEKKFPGGIATFYLFDSQFKFLSERSVFINEENINVKASVDKKVYGKRDKVTLNVSITDGANNPVPSLFSVAVIDSAFSNSADDCMLPEVNNPTSIDNLGLGFTNCNAEEDVTDILMLLKNNTYRDINKNVKKFYPANDDSLLFIKGRVMDEKNNPAINKVLTLLSKSGNEIFLTDTTSNTGQFMFPATGYADNSQFAIEARNGNNRSMKVKIVRDPIPFPNFRTPISLKQRFSVEPVFTSKYRVAYLDTIIDAGKRLPVIIIKGKNEEKFNSLKRVSRTSTIITSDQLDERQSVGNTILNVSGMHLLNGFLVINGLTSMQSPNAGSEPLLLIDGVKTANAGSPDRSPVMETLNSLNPKEIDFIEILKGGDAANYGLRGGNGVILVNMSTKPWEKFETSGNNIQTFYAKGILRSPLFPVINYDSKEFRTLENIDNRSTLFWDGSILSQTANVNLSFFTNDIPGTYKIKISGITVHGDIINKTIFFQSK